MEYYLTTMTDPVEIRLRMVMPRGCCDWFVTYNFTYNCRAMRIWCWKPKQILDTTLRIR